MNKRFLADFHEEGIYHVYNRTNNKESLFISDENRFFFLTQFTRYLHPFLQTYCWCLLPNHFHFLVKIRSEKSIKSYLGSLESVALKSVEKKYLNGEVTAEVLLEFEWKRFFTTYSMAFNRKYERSGNLFHRPFKRVAIVDDHHFTQVVIYIHANPVKHGLCTDYTKYKWSSWQALVNDRASLLCRHELLEWFGGLENFIIVHQSQTVYYYHCDVGIEDD